MAREEVFAVEVRRPEAQSSNAARISVGLSGYVELFNLWCHKSRFGRGTVAYTNERFIMNSIMFTLVPIFIGVVALFVFGGVFMTFLSAFRHRGMIQQITDEALRQSRSQSSPQQQDTQRSSSAPSDYACDNCGAALGTRTEISPSGDFKCEYCDSWSNVKT